MAVLAIAAVGAGVGAAFGSASIGWAVGSVIGGLLFPPKQPTQYNIQPQLTDLRVTQSEYGADIPYIRGARRVAGSVIWNSDLRPITTTTSSTSGGKGGGGGQTTVTQTTTYDIDVLILVSDNEIAGIGRIWLDGLLIWTADADATTDSLAASADSPHWDRLTVYSGAADQLPDPTYEAAVLDNVGDLDPTLACAYRGRGTIFIQNWHLGQSGQLRNLTFEVVADGSLNYLVQSVVEGVTDNRYYILAVSNQPSGYYNGLKGAGQVWLINYQTAPNVAYGDLVLFDVDTETHVVSVANDVIAPDWAPNNFELQDVFSNNDCFVNPSMAPAKEFVRVSCVDGSIRRAAVTTGAYVAIVDTDDDNRLWATAGHYYEVNWDTGVTARTPLNGSIQINNFLTNAQGIAGRVYYQPVGQSTYYYIDKGALNRVNSTIPLSDITSSYSAPLVGNDNHIYVYGISAAPDDLRKYDTAGTLIASVTLPLADTGGSAKIFAHDSNGILWCRGTTSPSLPWITVDAATMTISQTIASQGFTDAIAEYELGRMLFYSLATTGGDFGELGLSVATITKTAPTVAEVQADICERAGLTAAQYDVTALSSITRDVDSMVWSGNSSGRAASELLMGAYFYQCTQSDKLYFTPRGSAVADTIDYDELGATQGDFVEPFALRRASDLEIPSRLALNYINLSADYQTDTQSSDRLVSAASETVETLQMNLGMTPAVAKAVVDTLALERVVAGFNSEIALLGDHTALQPGDVLSITDSDGSVYRMRAVKKDDEFPLQKFAMVLDDANILSSQGITSADYTSNTAVAISPSTLVELLDIPILQDSDDDAGFYVATKGSSTPYPGAAIYDSNAGVSYSLRTTVDESAILGTASTTLGDFAGGRVFDESNTVTVDVGAGTLASSTHDEVLDDRTINAMLVGDEIIQFRTATFVSTGIYTLSGLLRGDRGTDWAIGTHGPDETVVLLRAAGLRRIALDASLIGIERYYKGVTRGRTLGTATAELFTNTAVGKQPLSPIYSKVTRDGSNNITFTWQRRTRMIVRMIGTAGISAPLGEETERYEIDIYGSGSYTTVLRTISATSETAAYTAASQTADGLTPGNAVYFKIYQLSDVIGRGRALTASG